MVQKTAWEGQVTRRLRKQKKITGASYTRYANTKKKTGLQIVTPHENFNEVRTIGGGVGIERKYAHPYGNIKKSQLTSSNPQYQKEVKNYKKRMRKALGGKK